MVATKLSRPKEDKKHVDFCGRHVISDPRSCTPSIELFCVCPELAMNEFAIVLCAIWVSVPGSVNSPCKSVHPIASSLPHPARTFKGLMLRKAVSEINLLLQNNEMIHGGIMYSHLHFVHKSLFPFDLFALRFSTAISVHYSRGHKQ